MTHTSIKRFLLVGLSMLLLWWTGFAITNPAIKNPWLDLYLEVEWLDYTTPVWFQPHDQNTAPENIDYWLNILPFSQDKNADTYLVIPWLGLITPIVDIPKGTSDYDKMISGQEIAINDYLQWWIIEYVSSAEPGSRGKRIDFGHSNYFTTDSGRYKTIFANLMRLDPGDQIRYFVKQSDWSYKLFKYNIEKSYPTDPSNVQALQWDGDGADALVFGCYHWLDGRWMIEASYMWVPTWRYIEETVVVERTYENVPQSYQRRIKDAIQSMKYLWINAKKYEIIILFKWIQRARAKLSTSDSNYAMKAQLLEMMEDELAEIYPE